MPIQDRDRWLLLDLDMRRESLHLYDSKFDDLELVEGVLRARDTHLPCQLTKNFLQTAQIIGGRLVARSAGRQHDWHYQYKVMSRYRCRTV